MPDQSALLHSMLLVRVPKRIRDDFAALASREGKTRSEILRVGRVYVTTVTDRASEK